MIAELAPTPTLNPAIDAARVPTTSTGQAVAIRFRYVREDRSERRGLLHPINIRRTTTGRLVLSGIDADKGEWRNFAVDSIADLPVLTVDADRIEDALQELCAPHLRHLQRARRTPPGNPTPAPAPVVVAAPVQPAPEPTPVASVATTADVPAAVAIEPADLRPTPATWPASGGAWRTPRNGIAIGTVRGLRGDLEFAARTANRHAVLLDAGVDDDTRERYLQVIRETTARLDEFADDVILPRLALHPDERIRAITEGRRPRVLRGEGTLLAWWIAMTAQTPESTAVALAMLDLAVRMRGTVGGGSAPRAGHHAATTLLSERVGTKGLIGWADEHPGQIAQQIDRWFATETETGHHTTVLARVLRRAKAWSVDRAARERCRNLGSHLADLGDDCSLRLLSGEDLPILGSRMNFCLGSYAHIAQRREAAYIAVCEGADPVGAIEVRPGHDGTMRWVQGHGYGNQPLPHRADAQAHLEGDWTATLDRIGRVWLAEDTAAGRSPLALDGRTVGQLERAAIDALGDDAVIGLMADHADRLAAEAPARGQAWPALAQLIAQDLRPPVAVAMAERLRSNPATPRHWRHVAEAWTGQALAAERLATTLAYATGA